VFQIFRNRSFQAILAYLLMQVGGAFLASFLVLFSGIDEYVALIYTNISVFMIGLIIIYLLLRKELLIEQKENPLTIGRIILWSVVGLILAYLGQMFAVMIEMNILDIKLGSDNTDLIVKLSQMNILFILLPALIGPIIEELVFRKALFGSLAKKMNLHVAAVISALIFALIHFDFEHTLIYFVMGLVFTFLYVQTKRIIIPILAHMGMNSLAVISQLLIGPEEIERLREQIAFILLGGWL